MKIRLTPSERALLWAILPPRHPLLVALSAFDAQCHRVYADVSAEFSMPVPRDIKVTLTKKGNLKGSLRELQPYFLSTVTLDDVSFLLYRKIVALLGELPDSVDLPLVEVKRCL